MDWICFFYINICLLSLIGFALVLVWVFFGVLGVLVHGNVYVICVCESFLGIHFGIDKCVVVVLLVVVVVAELYLIGEIRKKQKCRCGITTCGRWCCIKSIGFWLWSVKDALSYLETRLRRGHILVVHQYSRKFPVYMEIDCVEPSWIYSECLWFFFVLCLCAPNCLFFMYFILLDAY